MSDESTAVSGMQCPADTRFGLVKRSEIRVWEVASPGQIQGKPNFTRQSMNAASSLEESGIHNKKKGNSVSP